MDRAERYRVWKEEHPEEYAAQLRRNREWKARNRSSVRGFMQMLLANSKTNAAGREHTLTLDYLVGLWERQGGICALTGDLMTLITGTGRHNPTNVSLDRIDPTRGYTPENVWLVCQVANRVKTDLSLDDLLDTCRKILERHSLQEGVA